MPSMTSPLRSRFWLLLIPSRRSRLSAVRVLLPFGEAWPVGVLVVEGVSAGWEKRPNSEWTRGADEVGAYEVCEVSNGGRLEQVTGNEVSTMNSSTGGASESAALDPQLLDLTFDPFSFFESDLFSDFGIDFSEPFM